MISKEGSDLLFIIVVLCMRFSLLQVLLCLAMSKTSTNFLSFFNSQTIMSLLNSHLKKLSSFFFINYLHKTPIPVYLIGNKQVFTQT